MKDLQNQDLEDFEDYYKCPYCGRASAEPKLCCGEMHGEEIILAKEIEDRKLDPQA